MKIRQVDIFGINFAVTDYVEATRLIIIQALNNAPFAVFALPVHGVIEIKKDAEFNNATLAADLIVPDGQPVRWAMNFFYNANLKDRVYGPKLVTEVLTEADRHKLRVFLYGGRTEQVLQNFAEFINTNYTGVEVCGTHREADIKITTLDAAMIKQSGANIVLVGLGCPLQEKWIAKNKEGADAVLMGVGAAFSFHAGDLEMAPTWMQNNGLEWLYRVFKEPKRLWKRYLVTNTHFVYLFIRKILKF